VEEISEILVSSLCLNSSNYHCIHNIFYQAATAKVVYGFVESLQNRTNSYGISSTLHGFVSIVSGIYQTALGLAPDHFPEPEKHY